MPRTLTRIRTSARILAATVMVAAVGYAIPAPAVAATPALRDVAVSGLKIGTLADLYAQNQAAQAAARDGATTQAWSCGDALFVIQSRGTGKYASTEIGYPEPDYGMIRARAAAIGPWEYYLSCYDAASNYNAFISYQNARYLRAEVNYPGGSDGMVRAAGTLNGTAEQFRLSELGTGWYTLRSRITGKYVTTEVNYPGNRDGMLRARSSTVGAWEQYR